MFILKKEIRILLIVSVLILSSSVIAMNNVDEREIDSTDISTPDLISTPEQNGYFITNEGQWSSEIKFISQTSFGHVAISQSGLLLNMVHDNSSHSTIYDDNSISDLHYASQGTIIEIEFMGSNLDDIKGMEELPSVSNFMIGNDESKWKTDVKNYQMVLVSNIWNNIDFRLYFSGDLKYDFILRPGADINNIRMTYDGQQNIEVTDKEIIIIDYFGRSLIDGNLFTYYEENGEEIDSRYICRGDSIISYELEKYNEDKVVIIDPMIYSTYLGGSSNDYTSDLVILDESNLMISGYTLSFNFPTTTGVYNKDNSGSRDIYIIKYNYGIKQIVYSTYLGGSFSDYSKRIFTDQNDNNIIIGITSSDDFPTTNDGMNKTRNGQEDLIISILNPSCSILLYSTYYGGESEDYVKGSVYWNDSIYICGITKSSNFPISEDAYQKSWVRGYDGFISVFNIAEKIISSSTYIGGDGDDHLYDIETNEKGIYIIGSTYSSDYPVSINALKVFDDQSLMDIVITKFNQNLSSILYSTYFGGSGWDEPHDLELMKGGEICIGGVTSSSDFYTTENGFDRSFNGHGDMFVSILNCSQPSVRYSTYIGGDKYESLWEISFSPKGGILIAGNTSSSNFPITQGSFDTSFNSGGTYNSDIILMKFNPNLTSLLYSTFIGGSDNEWVKRMEIDNENIHILGYSRSVDFPTTPDSSDPNHNGGYDGIYLL